MLDRNGFERDCEGVTPPESAAAIANPSGGHPAADQQADDSGDRQVASEVARPGVDNICEFFKGEGLGRGLPLRRHLALPRSCARTKADA